MTSRPRVVVHNTFLEVDDEEMDDCFELDVGFSRAQTDPAKPLVPLPDRTPTPTWETVMPEDAAQDTAASASSGMPFGVQEQQPRFQEQSQELREPQPGQVCFEQQLQQPRIPLAVPKAYGGQLAPLPEGAAMHGAPMNQFHHAMGIWQTPYQPAPPPYQQPMGGSGDAGAQFPGFTPSQLQSLEQDPELAVVFQEIRQQGPAAALRAFQDEGLMMKLSKKIGGQSSNGGQSFQPGCLKQSADAKAGNGPGQCGLAMPKAQCAPQAADWEGYNTLAEGMMQQGSQGEQAAPAQLNNIMPQGTAKHLAAGGQVHAQGLQAIDANAVISGTQKMDMNMVGKVVQSTIRHMTCCVCIADPSIEDCPLIGCSEGFEALTGYTRSEILGRNCRFLNEGVEVRPDVRQMMKQSVQSRGEFIGVLPNRRKNGEIFRNLLHMTTIIVRGKRYVVGIQADVSGLRVDVDNPGHVEELKALATRIFSGNIDAWVQIQVREFAIRQPVPYSKVLMRSDPAKFAEAQDKFVSIANIGAALGTKAKRSDLDAHPAANFALDCWADAGGKADTSKMSRQSTDQAGRSLDTEIPQASRTEKSETRNSEDNDICDLTLKSIGSAGHPDHCQAECVFHFFRGGCKGGANCRFCHEFHPRKNPKKNRRALRRFITNTGTEGSTVRDSEPDELSVCGNYEGQSTTTEQTHGRQISDSNSADLDGQEQQDQPRVGSTGRQDVVRISYGGDEMAPSSAARSAKMTIIAGHHVHATPKVEIAADCQGSLESCLQFLVEPSLPSGLTLDSRTGAITGIPESTLKHEVFNVTVGTQAMGPGNIELGLMPMASFKLELSIASLDGYALSWGCEDQDGRVTLSFRKR